MSDLRKALTVVLSILLFAYAFAMSGLVVYAMVIAYGWLLVGIVGIGAVLALLTWINDYTSDKY